MLIDRHIGHAIVGLADDRKVERFENGALQRRPSIGFNLGPESAVAEMSGTNLESLPSSPPGTCVLRDATHALMVR